MALDSILEIEKMFGIDHDDRRIMSMLYGHPELTHSQVAKISRSHNPPLAHA